MNGSRVLIDTNILLFLHDRNSTIENLLSGKDVFLSFITEIEILSKPGLKPSQINLLKRLLENFTIVDIKSNIKDLTAEIRREYKIKIPDAIIAATAKNLSIPLVTADKGFNKIKDASIIVIDI